MTICRQFCRQIGVTSKRRRLWSPFQTPTIQPKKRLKPGAESGTRTRTALRQPVFETGASTDSAISARLSIVAFELTVTSHGMLANAPTRNYPSMLLTGGVRDVLEVRIIVQDNGIVVLGYRGGQ